MHMQIEFDPAKDAENIRKHGISLARAADLETINAFIDGRFDEVRLRAYGYIDGLSWCLAYTMRNGNIRAISLRRAHSKEMKRYAP